jgi:hypothetical protein
VLGLATLALWPRTADRSGAVRLSVPANEDWTATDLTVREGQRISLHAAGEISTAPGLTNGPGGMDPDSSGELARLPGRHGALIARIGTGPGVVIGADGEIQARTAGELALAVNDANYQNDTGFYTVEVLVR